jgi:hypothetical protein
MLAAALAPIPFDVVNGTGFNNGGGGGCTADLEDLFLVNKLAGTIFG